MKLERESMIEDVDAEVLALLDSKILRGVERARVESVRELVTHGEVGIAVENLCENVFDLDGPFDSADGAWLSKLERVVRGLGLRPHYVRIVHEVMARVQEPEA